jgi:hypothetical protein
MIKKLTVFFLFFARLAFADWTLQPIAEYPRVLEDTPQKEGLSGIAKINDTEYYVVNDKYGLLHKVEIGMNRETGEVTNFVRKTTVTLEGRIDVEAVVWDSANNVVIIVDERDCTIRSFNPETGKEVNKIDIPEVYQSSSRIVNASFESLAMSPDGLYLWTCNESALRKDGAEASSKSGSDVRIQRFKRSDVKSQWVADGQWCYQTEKNPSVNLGNKRVCGIAELLVMPNGKLIALERRLKVAKWRIPSIVCGLYEIDFTGATDTSNIQKLCDADIKRVSKKCLYSANTGFAVYEGVCFGPKLNDGTQTLILVSDGDEGASSRVMSFKIKASN